ncbi:hypothetical protein KZO25_11070 [Halomonas sp. ANAO-440]|uniref:hypothetical protein n=1 Tax=Halomonas sp. ANAO-440 TaxID=2861360 RepID=UPI001CAA6D65|nr:hypothetical protein [Halomonas sp. ANAO-440]MBZ0330855.1 hypothetical protein [Halomonas sp. ANAO-440]
MPTTNTATPKPKRTLGETLAGLVPTSGKKNPQQKNLGLQDRLAARDKLHKQLESAEHEAGRLRDHVNRLRIKQQQARDAVGSWKATVTRGSGADREPRSAHRLKAAEAELQDISQRLAADEHQLLALQNQAKSMREQIDAMSQGATLDEVKQHLETLNSAEAEVERFEALIRTAEAEAEPATGNDEALDALQQAREDLLADIAAGDAKPKELEALDAEIREILEDGDGSQASALGQERDNAQTLAGLKRRLSAAQAHRDALAAQTPEVVEQMLIARAEAISKDYVKHAQALQLSYRQLQGVVELLTSAVSGTQVRLLSDQWPNLLIPSLPLRAFDTVSQCDAGRGVLFTGRQVRGADEVAQARTDELQQLDALGVGRLFQR